MSIRVPRIRTYLTALFAMLVILGTTSCALEGGSGGAKDNKSALTTVKVGYLHTVAVDSHMWLGLADGTWEKHGLKLEPVKFDTGVALSQALSGGSVDVGIMGAVMSNFPARGGSKIFLVNDVEYDTAQLWVHPDSGIKSVKDLAGKKVLTTMGTTAQVYLYTALVKNGVDPKSVTVVNASMSAAVTAFISNAAPAVVLWVPFDLTVKKNSPDAIKLDSASSYYPGAAILGGWITSDKFHKDHRDTLKKIAAGWLDVNEKLVGDTKSSLKKVHEKGYATTQDLSATEGQFSFEKAFPNDEWVKKYDSGEVSQWIGQVEKVFVAIGGLPAYREPSEFFDPSIFKQAASERGKQGGSN